MTNPTVFDALVNSIHKAAVFNKDDVVPPAAVLWTDEKREFERLIPRLRLASPNILTLGPYDPTSRTGPAIWLRCVLAGRLADFSLPTDAVPVLYRPGVSRPTLRATDECPPELRAARRVAVPGHFLVPAQRQGLDGLGVPPVGEGRSQSAARPRPRDPGRGPPRRREADGRSGRRPGGEVGGPTAR